VDDLTARIRERAEPEARSLPDEANEEVQSVVRRRKLRIFGTLSSPHYAAIAALGIGVIIGAWWIASALNLASDLFLPSPIQVVQRLVELAQEGVLWDDMWASFKRISVGFLISAAFALPLGVLIGTYRPVEAALEPSVDFIRYMPAVAFVPLTIIWVGLGEGQKYLIVFIGTFFQQVLLVRDNTSRVPREFVDIGYTLGMSESAIIRKIVIPAAAPAIWDTLRITLGWAWTYVVVAELVAASSGLGYRTILAQRYFQTETIFVVLLVIGILGLTMDQAMRLAGARLFHWAERRRTR
jgi:NitT/TauT family transport system permease protein